MNEISETRETLISADNLVFKIRGRKILKEVSLDLHEGEVLGVIGRNGAGKSILLKVLANILPAKAGALTLRGLPYKKLSARQFAQTVAYLEQSPKVHWPLRARKIIELGRSQFLNALGQLSRHDRQAIGRAVGATGVQHLQNRFGNTLSQGEFMLVNLCRIFASDPAAVLADEPVAALDPGHQIMIMEILTRQRALNPEFAAIVVLHDLTLAMRFCDRVALLHEGALACLGPPREVINQANLEKYYGIRARIDAEEKFAIAMSRL